MKSSYLFGTTAIAATLAAIAMSTPASAQEAAQDSTEIDEVIVTGSRLLTARQADALPLRVVTSEDLELQGSPPLMEVIRALPEAAGSIGHSNSSQAGKGQGFEVAESINLRGLGPDRNLVLLNGRRMPLVSGYFVNTRNIPVSAVDRIEVLKDAASTVYGSDAMTGVVNFITRRDLDGLEVGTNYTWVEDTEGSYELDATWGRVGDGWNVLLSAGYQSRARLSVRDRPWSTPPYEINPDAGWNFSANPAQFTPVGAIGPGGVLAATGPRVVDVGCPVLGGIQPFAGFCVFNVQKWQDLVAPAETYQLYSELNWELGGSTELHLEATYSNSEGLVHYPPSFNQPKPITETVLPGNINPASYVPGTSPRLFNNWFVPTTNPGLAAYMAANPGQFPGATTGIFIPIGQWRPYLVGGNPFYGTDPLASAYQTRDQQQFRLSAGLTGSFGDSVNWNADLTYGRNEHQLRGFDSAGVHIQLALRGLGGPNCQWQTAAPGSPGCLWLNPMSNAIASAPINGVASNPGYNAAVANTLELANWLMVPQERFLTSETTEANFGMDGLMGITLGGGDVAWALGGQWRRISFNETDSEYADRTRVPCLNSPLNIPNADICTPTPYTPLGLSAAFAPTDITTNIFAGFAELSVPLTETTDLTFGARYEDYGSDGGATFDPQVRAKIQLFDWLALRASASTTFRAPPQTSLAPNPLASIPTILGRPTALDVIGNPNLEPETATTYNLGLLIRAGNFDAGIDYYHYDVRDILTTEPQNAIVNAVFPNGAAGANNCATVSTQFLADHFLFNGPCSAANLSKVLLLRINGPDTTFSGIDLRASYRFDDVAGGDLTFNAVLNRTLSYEFDPFSVAGLATPGFEAVGFLNAGTLAHPLPEWKAQAFVNYNRGPVNLRWSVRYNDDYVDQRQATTAIGRNIASRALADFAAVIDLPRDVTLTLAVSNVFDVDPPLARLAEGYDAMTSDPLGRNFRIGLRKVY